MTSQLYQQPISTTGTDARTNVIYAIDRLKQNSPDFIPSDELIAYVLPIHKRDDEQQIRLFKQFLALNEKVEHDKKNDSYRFRPLHNIFNAEDLLAYLQRQKTALGINIRELKDGWPDVEVTIDKLEAQHKLLVTRNRKDNHARMVWADDPTLNASLDDEYKDMWEKIPLKEHKEIIQILQAENFHPAGSIAEPIRVAQPKKAKAKRKNQKVTNVHMQSMLRDYSKK